MSVAMSCRMRLGVEDAKLAFLFAGRGKPAVAVLHWLFRGAAGLSRRHQAAHWTGAKNAAARKALTAWGSAVQRSGEAEGVWRAA